ncbi:MAG: DUF1080 domain-containing protein [Agriterribacter sp.]
MTVLRSLFIVFIFVSISYLSVAQDNRIIVYADSVVNQIPSTLFGSCMEDVNHEIYGGLYDQKIMGESFEEPASGINYNDWIKYNGYWAADREYSDGGISIIPGRHTRRMIAKNELDVEPDGSAKLLCNTRNIGNGTIEAEMRFLQVKGIGAGILCRVSNAGIGENTMTGYEVRLNHETKKVQLIKHRNNFTLLQENTADFSLTAWNKVRITLDSDHITVFVNDSAEPIIDYTDTDGPITIGKPGLCTANTPVSFRNFKFSIQTATEFLPLVYPAHQHISDRWDMIASDRNNVQFSLLQKDAYNGLTAQLIELLSATGKAGVANRSLNRWGIAVEKGQTFTGSCFLHTTTGMLPVTVALESADGTKTYAQQIINVTEPHWKQYDFSLTANTTDTAARFALYFAQKGKLYVDQVTLMATGNKQFKGLPMRADIANAIVAEGLTFMRYAGSMVNAHGYRFKNMIGPRADRSPYTGHWNEYSSNGFGIEDFLQFCEAANFAAAFAVNIEESAADASDMVEYLNGDTTTVWGKKRAAYGHPKPYDVKYIEIGNEEVLFEGDDENISDHYIDRFLDLYKAIHDKDPSIKLVCSAWWRPESLNTKKIFKALDGKAAYWDYHVSADYENAGIDVDQNLTRMQNLFLQWNPATSMKCVIFEENGGLHNMQRALGHATILNAVRRHSDFVFTSCPANALQPYLQNDNGWDQGQIFFTPTQVWGMPPFYAQQMAASNYLPLRVKDSVEGKLNVTSTKSNDGKTLVLHIVNPDSVSQTASLLLNQFAQRAKKTQVYTLQGDLQDNNIPGNLNHVVTQKVLLNKPITAYTFPAHSYVILRFER